MVHIGKEIENKLQQSGMTTTEFARRINTVPRNVYDILARESIKTDQLKLISEVLNYNFFDLYIDKNNILMEESEKYRINKFEGVTICVVLDGEATTLRRYMDRLTRINNIIKTS